MNKPLLLFLSFLFLSVSVLSENVDTTHHPIQFSGNIGVTNNGVSLIPTFSLGKPAFTADMAVRAKRLSFEPMFFFATEKFRPWAFVYWLRYKLIQNEKFKMNVGVHPSFIFTANTILENGIEKEVLSATRYAAMELSPTYAISKNSVLGLYYLTAKQMGVGKVMATHFLALNLFSNIDVSEKYFIRFVPQLYYLKLGEQQGYYSNATVTIGKKKFPFSINGMVSKSIKTEIEINKFVWNAGLTYSF